MSPLLQRISRILALLFLIQALIVVAVLNYGEKNYRKDQISEAQNRVTTLDPVLSDEIVVLMQNQNREALDMLAYEIVQTKKLSFAQFKTTSEVREMIDKRNLSCVFSQLEETLCQSMDQLVGILPIRFGQKALGYLVQETVLRANKNSPIAWISYLSATLIFALVLNLSGLYLYFRKTLNREIKGRLIAIFLTTTRIFFIRPNLFCFFI